jgi:hypothetical protein
MWPVELEAEKIAELKAGQTKKSAEQSSTIETQDRRGEAQGSGEGRRTSGARPVGGSRA